VRTEVRNVSQVRDFYVVRNGIKDLSTTSPQRSRCRRGQARRRNQVGGFNEVKLKSVRHVRRSCGEPRVRVILLRQLTDACERTRNRYRHPSAMSNMCLEPHLAVRIHLAEKVSLSITSKSNETVRAVIWIEVVLQRRVRGRWVATLNKSIGGRCVLPSLDAGTGMPRASCHSSNGKLLERHGPSFQPRPFRCNGKRHGPRLTLGMESTPIPWILIKALYRTFVFSKTTTADGP